MPFQPDANPSPHNHSEQKLLLKSGSDVLNCSVPIIMGILNLTPDSFYDGGLWSDPERAYAHALEMVEQGASIIDVGAESSRPGAKKISAEEEMARLSPVLERICQLPVWVSIDTYKLATMRYAHSVGVKLFNNIRGFESEEALIWAAQHQVAICIMHMYGESESMATELWHPPEGVVEGVARYFNRQLARAQAYGLTRQNIVLDPGFGFGKALGDNYQLLTHLSDLMPSDAISLVGLSNKRMLQSLLPSQQKEGDKARWMSASNANATLYAALQGANILRVHDVNVARVALNFYQQIA